MAWHMNTLCSVYVSASVCHEFVTFYPHTTRLEEKKIAKRQRNACEKMETVRMRSEFRFFSHLDADFILFICNLLNGTI